MEWFSASNLRKGEDMKEDSPFLVTADWLEAHLKDPGLSVVDGSWYLPAQDRDARAEYEAAHIPRAMFFDHDAVVDPDLPCRIRCPTPHLRPPCRIDGHRHPRHDRRL